QEHYDLAEQEVDYFGGWFSFLRAKPPEQIEALRNSIDATILKLKDLKRTPELEKLKQKYEHLLIRLGNHVKTGKSPTELEAIYQKALTERHPIKAPEAMSERTRTLLKFGFGAAQLAQPFVEPCLPPKAEQPGINNSHFRAQMAAQEKHKANISEVAGQAYRFDHPEPSQNYKGLTSAQKKELRKKEMQKYNQEEISDSKRTTLKKEEQRGQGTKPSMPTADLSLLNPAQQKAALVLVPRVTGVGSFGKSGVNTAFTIKSPEGNFLLKTFTKEDEAHFLSGNDAKLTENFSAKHEASASVLGSYVTSGLVPRGRSSGDNIVYPLESIDREATSKVFTHQYPNYRHENIYARLSPTQRTDLFVNMLADMVLLNPDTHSGQFGINSEGRLIGFDKGRAFFDAVFKTKNLDSISMPADFLKSSKIYKDFIEELKKHPEDLKAILADEDVKQALSRIESLHSDAQRSSVKGQLNPLFTFIEHRANGNKALVEKLSESYFQMIKVIPAFLAKELGIQPAALVGVSTKHEIVAQDIDSKTKAVTFDPRKHEWCSVSAKDLGSPGGLRTSEIVAKVGGLAGMNAGFFAEGEGAQTGLGWVLAKAKQKTGMQTEAFPIAILKSSGRLLSDTSDFLPTLGIDKDGQAVIGDVKVVWQARLSPDGSAIPLARATDINLDELESTIYFKSGAQSKAITIKFNKVVDLKDVIEPDRKKPNGYWLHEPTAATVQAFEKLRLGDALSYGSQLEAKDPAQTEAFSKCPHVVSGGRILMSNGALDPRSHENHGRAGDLSYIGSVVGIHEDGRVSFIVRPGDDSIEKMVEKLKKMGIKKAISFDGGGSPSLVSPGQTGAFGYDRVVSDSLVAMPKKSNVLPFSEELAKQTGPLFKAVTDSNFELLKKSLLENPEGIHSRNLNGQSLLQSYLLQQSEKNQPLDDSMLKLLMDNMKPEDFESQDQLGETVVHSALRQGQTELARKVVDILGEDSDIWFMEGRSKQLISQLDNSFVIPERRVVEATFKGLESKDPAVQAHALEQLNVWISEGKYVDKAIAFAQAGVESSDPYVRSSALDLLGKLVDKGQGYAEAIAAAQAGVGSSDYYVRGSALGLLSNLVDKGQGYAEAIAFAQAGVGSSDSYFRSLALGLLGKLVAKGQGYAEAIAVAQAGVGSSDYYVRGSALG
ncbi:MAG: phosphodiester glycosidase family protein, partial [Myxococcaceae bacterium]